VDRYTAQMQLYMRDIDDAKVQIEAHDGIGTKLHELVERLAHVTPPRPNAVPQLKRKG
jgi:hypothetical protein